MEASQAGLGQGDNIGGPAPEGEAQQGPDVGALAEQLGSLTQGQEELRQFLMTQPWQAQEQEAGEEPQSPEVDLSFLDDPSLSPEQMSQQLHGLINEAAQQQAQQILQQHVSPLTQQVSEMRMEAQAERLTQEFPELAEEETATRVVQTARQYAEMMGRPELANDPAMWRLVYLAGRAADSANAEQGEEPAAAHLEGAGGAGPAGQQVDWAKQIVSGGDETALGKRALPFG